MEHATTNIPVSEAKAKFAELIRRVEAGEEVTLTRNGKPVARLAASRPKDRKKSIIGSAKGKVVIPDDFDVLGPEWDEYMY